MNIVEKVKNFVEEECKKPTSKYGYEPFLFHFTPMIKYADKLVDELGGDREITFIAIWLHDIGSIIYGRENHHLTGVEIAEEKLKELDYSLEKIELVKKCILNHRGSENKDRKSIEEQIVAEVDTMSAFDSLSGLFKAAFVYEKKSQKEARKSVMEKLENKWSQLYFKNSKKILKPKYEAVKLLLK